MAAANAAELDELNRKLKSSEDELDALNKRFDEAQGKPDWSIQILHYRTVNAVFFDMFYCLHSLCKGNLEAQGRA